MGYHLTSRNTRPIHTSIKKNIKLEILIFDSFHNFNAFEQHDFDP